MDPLHPQKDEHIEDAKEYLNHTQYLSRFILPQIFFWKKVFVEEMTKAEDEATRKEKEQEEEAKRQAIQE